MKHFQIAIDGPGGAGKTTIAKGIAEKLNFLFVNTGGMYRCYAIALKKTNLNDLEKVKKVLEKNKVEISPSKLFLNGIDVTSEANSAEISLLASKIGTIKTVREKCVKDQQKIAEKNNVVMEGRDTTTVVLPNATLKVFLTASLGERARRRWNQHGQKGDLEQIKFDLEKRDFQDSTRSIAPLQKTPDAFLIDGDSLTVKETIAKIISEFNKRVSKNA